MRFTNYSPEELEIIEKRLSQFQEIANLDEQAVSS